MEAHVARSIDSMMDRAKQAMMLETDRPHVLREMIYVCRPAGVISIPRRLRRPGGQDPVRGCGAAGRRSWWSSSARGRSRAPSA
ncbi:MAG TPA: hypothetical protein VFK48_18185 [Usitatibacter sp.]|nr:hypothetical protein [Usitatibacter sp.]